MVKDINYVNADVMYTANKRNCDANTHERLDTSVLASEKRTPCEIWSRVMGYYRPVTCWNKGKQQEYKDRQSKTFKEPTLEDLSEIK